jgi:glyoxylase-like metal-dependent hydrolase (beta-lactamase superfamily II)
MATLIIVHLVAVGMDPTRIRLGNTVFEGRNNAYLLRGDVTTLVDVGAAMGDIRDDLTEGLGDCGLSFADVDQVLLTHWHADHAGLAGEVQAESGAVVRVHEADAPLVAGASEAVAEEQNLRRRRFDEWGIPDEKRRELVAFLDRHEELEGDPVEVTTLADGDVVAAGDTELETLHLPGHTAGLTAFAAADGASEVAFVGDAILPKYTPNVGGADLRVDRPLERYVESLRRLVDRDFDRALPGHRDPVEDPTDRAEVILNHHRERTERVVSVLERRARADPWTVSADLFGELSDIHILHGPGEAFAHLDHLVGHGVAERDGDAYRLVEDDPDVSALFPNTKY